MTATMRRSGPFRILSQLILCPMREKHPLKWIQRVFYFLLILPNDGLDLS